LSFPKGNLSLSWLLLFLLVILSEAKDLLLAVGESAAARGLAEEQFEELLNETTTTRKGLASARPQSRANGPFLAAAGRSEAHGGKCALPGAGSAIGFSHSGAKPYPRSPT
jgi:hypothetical protein